MLVFVNLIENVSVSLNLSSIIVTLIFEKTINYNYQISWTKILKLLKKFKNDYEWPTT